jgi:hypothetical protein
MDACTNLVCIKPTILLASKLETNSWDDMMYIQSSQHIVANITCSNVLDITFWYISLYYISYYWADSNYNIAITIECWFIDNSKRQLVRPNNPLQLLYIQVGFR